ncbi:hypothetical protein T10_11763 [Trichinella papuae]|uniref:Uncharacterized protein n=1 Tax=Trichinella papuae TaxID=268474 RepID=A0A0V1MUA6_9BILA|nr:hypothetical protein T10_11763 [Trichinella papuae]
MNSILGFEKLFIILRTLIIRKTIQCTASHHTFTQQNSVNVNIFSYNFSERNLRNNEILHNMKCIIKSDAEHKRNFGSIFNNNNNNNKKNNTDN